MRINWTFQLAIKRNEQHILGLFRTGCSALSRGGNPSHDWMRGMDAQISIPAGRKLHVFATAVLFMGDESIYQIKLHKQIYNLHLIHGNSQLSRNVCVTFTPHHLYTIPIQWFGRQAMRQIHCLVFHVLVNDIVNMISDYSVNYIQSLRMFPVKSGKRVYQKYTSNLHNHT